MRVTLAISVILLALEGALAWLSSGNPFLLMAGLTGVLGYAAVGRASEGTGETVRAAAAGIIAIAGPVYHQAKFFPLAMSFLALAHLLAATQCLWEMSWGRLERPNPPLRLRGLVFTVGFYATMAFAVVLLRTDLSPLPPVLSVAAAVLVAVMAIPAWESSRLMRLRAARPGTDAAARPNFGAWLAGLAALVGLGFLFATALPPAAEALCRISPRWQSATADPGPPQPQTQEPLPEDPDAPATRPGLDSSAMTGRHRLPDKADIKSAGQPRLHVRIEDAAARDRLRAAGPLYVRSHAMDSFREQAWSPAVRTGSWVEDGDDGASDGMVALTPQPADAIRHDLFLLDADGYSLPALQNVTAYQTDRLYVVPGGTCQLQVQGNVRYSAVSAPRRWQELVAAGKPLRTGSPPHADHLKAGDNPTIERLLSRDPLLRDAPATLEGRIDALQRWFAANTRYGTVMKGGKGLSGLDDFLIGERVGFCDFYATAAALFLRAQGIPSRIAYGYAGGTFDETAGVFTFTDRSAHAWTELWLDGHGWTICDFTPAPSIGALGPPDADGTTPSFDEGLFEPLKPTDAKGTPDAAAAARPDASWLESFAAALQSVRPLDLVKQLLPWLALAAALAIAVRRWQARTERKAAKDGASSFADDLQQPLYLKELVRVAAAAGHRQPRGATVREYFRHLMGEGFIGADFLPLLSYHYTLRYEDGPADAGVERDFLARIRALARPQDDAA